jgi:hypothetical protein
VRKEEGTDDGYAWMILSREAYVSTQYNQTEEFLKG